MARPRKVDLLFNPCAGRRHGAARAARIVRDVLTAAGCQVRPISGATREEAVELAGASIAERPDALVTCGGDGTLSTALEILAGTDVPLGIVAVGSGNDFARSLGLPRHDPKAAARVVLTGRTRPVDLGLAGNRRFATIMTSGFDSHVNERFDRLHWPERRTGYLAAIFAELVGLRSHPFTLTTGSQVQQRSATLVAVGNGRFYGNGLRMCPGASVDDALLDVIIVDEMSRGTLIRLLPSAYRGRHVHHAAVTTFRTPSITIDAPGVTAYADGELIGPLPLDVSACPGGVEVFV